MPTTIAVTGATGFVGSALFHTLKANNQYVVKGLCRTLPDPHSTAGLFALGSLEAADFSQALVDVDVVIHTAARAHIMADKVDEPLAEYRRVNVYGSLNLARQAAQAGVKRLVFISSIGVNGGHTQEAPFTETSIPKPHSDYAQSKLEAELALKRLCTEVGLELVIIRPPLIYAAQAPGNFGRLLKVVNKRVPLPFALVKNKRSFVALDNMISFTILCAQHPKAANQIFLAADDNALSTPELLTLLGAGLGKKVFLLPVPVSLMRWGAKLLGREAMFEQLCDSLEVDNTKAKTLLNWQPPLTTAQAMQKTAQHFLASTKH